ncbi:MAG: HIT domain-containing protein [Candidatus Neomarinimicrobiota bacterium]
MEDKNRLWAPWRMEYIRAPKATDCIFCDKSRQNKDRANLLLYRGKDSFVLMNLYPYNNGHLMIAPYRHGDSIHDLSAEAKLEIMTLADQTMKILARQMNTQGFNFGANLGAAAGAGIAEHLHFHIVPRWSGDTNFMPVLGHTKVMVQGLLETYDQIKPEFDLI